MSFATRHDPKQVMSMSTCSLLPGCLINFFDSQVNAAVFMLQRIFRVISLHKSRSANTSLQKVVEKLEMVWTYSRFVVDTMGFEKTHTTFLFIAYYAAVTAKRKIPGQVNFHSIFCVVPSGMVLHQ